VLLRRISIRNECFEPKVFKSENVKETPLRIPPDSQNSP
jgi:hypothetical protein